MARCPSCGRPRASARATCLYCGGALPPEPDAPKGEGALAAAEPGRATKPWPALGFPEVEAPLAASDRWLVVLDLSGASTGTLARALGLSPYDAGLLARRGGWHLHRVLEGGAEAEAEVLRLSALGLAARRVPEGEARVRPRRVLAGERGDRELDLRTEEGPLVVRRGEVLLVVAGPVAREFQASERRRRFDTARPEEGYRVHLHLREDARPLEIDVASVEVGFAVTGSARLEVDAWVREVAGDAACDDGFRRLPPALAPAEPEPAGPLSAVRSLGLAARAKGGRLDDRVVVLDNAAQFRFYSAWRAAVERRLRGASP